MEAYGPVAFIGFLVVVFFGSVGLLLWPSSSQDDGFLTAEEVRLLTDAARSEAEESETYPPLGRTSSLESETDVDAGAVDLFVDTAPSGAVVSINGDVVGVAPLDDRQLSSNWHVVAVEKEGFIARDTFVYIDGGAPARIKLALTPSGRVQEPSRAEPETSREAESVDVALVPQTGDLAVVVRPWGSVYINGTLRARDTDVRFDASLPVGRHHVRVVHPELGAQERMVDVQPHRTASATFYLE